METINPETGEVTTSDFEERSADGGRRYPSVTTLTDLVHMLNDGAFNQESADALGNFSADMEELGVDTGKKVKGKITLTIDVEREADGVYFFTPQMAVKLPPAKVGRTIGWVTPDNRFTPNRPHQGNLFGTMREIDTRRVVREA